MFEILTPTPIPQFGESPITEITDDMISNISLAVGGRQDNFIGMFSDSSLPCVGISFDVNEIFNITKTKLSEKAIRRNEVDVYVMAFGDGLLRERIQVCKELWNAGVKV